MKKGYRKCVCCERYFDMESCGYYAERGDDEGKPLCDSCYCDDSSDAQQIIWWEGEDKEKTYVGSYTIQGEWDRSMRPELYEYIDSLAWVASGGWRGYYQGRAPKGWVSAIDTWFGTMDGYNLEDKSALFEKKFDDDGLLEAPCPIIVGFLRTSNCCSCGLEVLVREEDQEKFDNWLQTE